jgi:hypothetical protein
VLHAVSELIAADEALGRLAGWPAQHFTKDSSTALVRVAEALCANN